jgi:hypothetical protein
MAQAVIVCAVPQFKQLNMLGCRRSRLSDDWNRTELVPARELELAALKPPRREI